MDYEAIYSKEFLSDKYNRPNPDRCGRFLWTHDVVAQLRPTSLLDIGVGRGLFLEKIQKSFPEIEVAGLDVVNVNRLKCPFIQMDITQSSLNEYFEVITCLDVLEHIHEDDLDFVLKWISKCAHHFIFTIANHSDIGKSGQQLHLIQQSIEWWTDTLKQYFTVEHSGHLKDNLYGFICQS